MATTVDLSATYTMSDLAARLNNDKLQAIVPSLSQMNPLIEVGRFEKANNVDYHKLTRQLTLPSGTLVGYNQGVDADADTVKPVTEYMSMLELPSVVDKRLADNVDVAMYRAQRDAAAREGLLQQMANYFFYGDHNSDEKEFDGLAKRLNATSQDNVYSAGGSSALTSIYIVQFGDQRCSLIYPNNHQTAGIDSEDMDVQLWEDADGKNFRAYVTWHKWYMGLAVYDERCIRRVANIETGATPTNGFDPDLLLAALVDMPYNGDGTVIFMEKDVYTQLLKNAKDKMNVQYTPDAPWGPKTRSDFIGYPIRIFEKISRAETAVS